MDVGAQKQRFTFEFAKKSVSLSMLIDTHAHLTFDPLINQIDDVVRRAYEAQVEKIITVGTSIEDSANAWKLSIANENIFVSVGIHPHEADKIRSADGVSEIIEGEGAGKIVAIGETGLDYYYDFASKSNQRELFESHIAIALRYNLPLIIHCREAFDDTMSILKHYVDRLKCVFHCFTGSEKEAKLILNAGWFISLTGVVTFKNAKELQKTIKSIGASKLLIETDSPYMTPEPIRKQRINEPANVKYIAGFLANLLNLPIENLCEILHNNTLELFSNLAKG